MVDAHNYANTLGLVFLIAHVMLGTLPLEAFATPFRAIIVPAVTVGVLKFALILDRGPITVHVILDIVHLELTV